MTVLTRAQVSAYATQAGFTGNALNIALAVAQAESSYNTQAIDHDSNGSTDYGLWQINSIHGYNSGQLLSSPLYNAQAAYKISSSGTNWNPWTTYTSGAYKKYLSTGNPSNSVPQAGKSNGYPKGQCTWYANERYHTLAGYYVPWSGNAKDWSKLAPNYGWTVSSTPVAPSIICLQAGVQGADSTYGHVAAVESLGSNGIVHTTDQNWGLTASARASTSHVDFKTGAGVSFITAAIPLPGVGPVYPGSSSPTGTPTGLQGDLQGVFAAWGNLFGGVAVTPGASVLEQVHTTLIDNPGFYGIALALDEAEQFAGYQNLASGPFDVIGMIRSVGATISDNMLPAWIRYGLISVGSLIIFLLIAKVVLQVGGDALQVAGKVLPLVAGV